MLSVPQSKHGTAFCCSSVPSRFRATFFLASPESAPASCSCLFSDGVNKSIAELTSKNELQMERLGTISSMIESVLQKFEELSNKFDGIPKMVEMMVQGGDMRNLENRVSSMELLLFRTRLDDFKFIDERIADNKAQPVSHARTDKNKLDEP